MKGTAVMNCDNLITQGDLPRALKDLRINKPNLLFKSAFHYRTTKSFDLCKGRRTARTSVFNLEFESRSAAEAQVYDTPVQSYSYKLGPSPVHTRSPQTCADKR